jgi:hypothetical protein
VARVGELLVASGVITREQCEHALHSQVLWGGRLGTNLIELGFADLDSVARALSRQQRIAAALAHHFEAADLELQERMSPDVAERFACLPLMRVQGAVIIAAAAPLDEHARTIIAAELCCHRAEIQTAIAAELRIRYQLERIYEIPRDSRFLRVRGPQPLVAPTFEINDVDVSGPVLELASASDSARTAERARRNATPPLGGPIGRGTDTHATVTEAAVARAPTRDRRQYVETLARIPADQENTPVGRVPLKRLAIGTDGVTAVARSRARTTTLGEATRAIRRSADREAVGQLVVQTIAQFLPSAEAAMVFMVRGEAAIATAGYSRHLDSLPEIAVPLSEPGLLRRVIRFNTVARQPAKDLGPIDYLLISALGVPEGDLVVAPISISNQVIGVIALAMEREAPIDSADSITAAAGAAFARLIRDADR